MTSIKELKSIELSSFTIITTGIAVLFSIITSIVLVIGIGIASPSAIGTSIYIICTIIVGTLMYTTYNAFCQGFLYNTLTKKLNAIQIELKDNKEIIKVSTTQTAIIISMITTIQVILLYLVSVFIFPLLLNTIIQTLMFSGQEAIAYSLFQFLMLLTQPTTVAMIIFGTFIISFVFVLIGCLIYNFIANTGRGAVVNLSQENDFTAIDSIDVLKFSIVFGIIGGVLNLISIIFSFSSGNVNIIALIGNAIGGFIIAFVNVALLAVFYNFLAPKLGKLKIELIDQ